jgi:hypothetical protein
MPTVMFILLSVGGEIDASYVIAVYNSVKPEIHTNIVRVIGKWVAL